MTNQEIVALYQDKSFKGRFIGNYLKAKSSTSSFWSESEAEQQWLTVFNMLAAAHSSADPSPIHKVSKTELMASMLYVSETGLSFRKEDKEIYLYTECADGRHHILKTRLGYKGMMRIVMGTGLFRYISVELVLQGDTFSWLGQEKAPVFVSAGPVKNRDVECGFVGFKYLDGDRLYFKIDGDELLQIERASKAHAAIAYGDESSSLYSTPWRHRMLAIAVWRNAYNRLRQVVIFGSALSQSMIDQQGNVEFKPESPPDFLDKFGAVDRSNAA